ncbi:hypothetical protein Godav_024044, partial [Gossypium davidsonii]|nr:hypothetical protein [Gossypium davidsonii]
MALNLDMNKAYYKWLRISNLAPLLLLKVYHKGILHRLIFFVVVEDVVFRIIAKVVDDKNFRDDSLIFMTATLEIYESIHTLIQEYHEALVIAGNMKFKTIDQWLNILGIDHKCSLGVIERLEKARALLRKVKIEADQFR